MPRPSMAGQRREEILDALETCILEKGIQGTSLEYLAETANMKRTILRHYLGNRDDIICALSKRWREKFDEQWHETLSWLPEKNRVNALIDILFAARSESYLKATVISDALFSEAKRLAPVKDDQIHSMNMFVRIVSEELGKEFTTATAEHCELVASGIQANYLMSETLHPLGLADDISSLKSASLLLITTLADAQSTND